MLNVTKTYKPTRAKILTYSQIEKVLRQLKNEGEELNFKIIICLMFFGLLRGCEVLSISRDEVEIEEETREVNVTYKKSTKTRVSGFSYIIPPQFADVFEKYFTEWDGKDESENLVKNFAPTTHKKRRTNTGWRTMGKMLRRMEQILGLKKNSLTTHCLRRSAATCLANGGASLIQLKRAGRWNSDKVAQEYIEYCLPEKRKRVNMLTGGNVVDIRTVSIYKYVKSSLTFILAR